jgi:hypothetical protein
MNGLMTSRFILIYLILMIYLIILPNHFPHYVFAASPSFGYQEVRDPFRDIIDVKCLKDVKAIDVNNCQHTNEGNQSTDIVATDYFSDGRLLNATLWLFSHIKESSRNSINNHEETNYGMFIDADSNQKTGWQGIDYQVEDSRKDGRWYRTFYEFSSLSSPRILEQKNYTEQFYNKNGKYVTLYADLHAMGSPAKYRVMFYAEEVLSNTAGAILFWKDDFTNWIDIPRPDVSLLATPSHIVLRPGQQDSFGIQLTSNTSLVPQVSNFMVKENTNNVQLHFVTNPLYTSSSNEPAYLEVTIPEDAKIGTYNIPIVANVTQTSTIPNIFGFKNLVLNTAYEFDNVNLPITVVKRMNIGEELAEFNKTWVEPLSGIYTFIGGFFTGGLAQWIYRRTSRKQDDKCNKKE